MALPLLAQIVTGVWSATARTLSTFGSLAADIWLSTTRTLTEAVGLTTPEHDHLMALSNADLSELLGLAGHNVRWSEMAFDISHHMTSAVITQYTDNTLAVPLRSWLVTATYDTNGELTAYQMVLQ